ncbi:hypothetical protein NDN08_005201 [Rhodosorus marinus]|uniref:Uncharacterized protein n=1 Tax=Rhodosorus marinus TaxID=101924 RepID=A0AAV8V3V8_9RHOD|nr:hypothetical protein NDN08_005201 [Rhodosorus marinus]
MNTQMTATEPPGNMSSLAPSPNVIESADYRVRLQKSQIGSILFLQITPGNIRSTITRVAEALKVTWLLRRRDGMRHSRSNLRPEEGSQSRSRRRFGPPLVLAGTVWRGLDRLRPWLGT